MSDYFIGLMSGTSLDGVDAALVRFESDDFTVVATHYQAYAPEMRERLQRVCYAQRVEFTDLGELDAALGELFAACCQQLLAQAGVDPAQVRALGSHGQTVYHHPRGQYPFTLQIGDPNRIAQITGIATVADFRRRDIAAGGQGAPLAPAFHQYAFGGTNHHRIVINIGGIANVTVIPPGDGGTALGFDCGPGNTLMDHWAQRHLGTPCDLAGAWARTGQVDSALLQRLLDDPYFRTPPPKSTGQEYFSPEWLSGKLQACDSPPQDIQATLCHLTASAIVAAISPWADRTDRLLVCGGGSKNACLMETLQKLSPRTIATTEACGIHPDWVEAVAFAWLARQTLAGKPGNLPSVTGACGPVVLGAVYPGSAN
ncbi:MAG: anhydro-N-acetylmuramic acid kinase [Methylococcaceae bacterium]|nr:anhydro-N-acetylmuramic acid kinase [Methylococcaceae bacterium]